MKFIKYLFLFSVFSFSQNNVLDAYISIAIQSNLALKQKQFLYEQSQAALSEARGMFFPSVSIEARYSRAGGGREINMPIGDLVNPIYSALNQVVGAQAFPTDIPNQTIPFLREKEHETKLQVVQPIFQPAIYYNYKAKSSLTEVEKAGRDTYTRSLIAEVKTAYFNYLKTLKIQKLLISTDKLLKENLRVSESLFKNGKVTKDAVYKAEAELSRIKQQQSEAKKNNNLARSYFNFLLNRDFSEEIDVDSNFEMASFSAENFNSAEMKAASRREELFQLEFAEKAADYGTSAAKTSYYPGLTFVFDYGFQGEEYKLTNEYDYWMASLIFQWNIFKGFSDKAKVEQNQIRKIEIETQKLEAEKKIQLQIQEAFYNLKVAGENIETTAKREKSSSMSFDIIRKKYEEGMAPQIEYIDARNTLTQSEIEAAVAEYDYAVKAAEYEKAAALIDLNKFLENDRGE